MKRAPGIALTSTTTTTYNTGASVALVGFEAEDRDFLLKAFDCMECPIEKGCNWKIRIGEGVDAVLRGVRRGCAPIVFWDGDRKPDAWKGLLEKFSRQASAPPLIVASRLADERLWAEALNLGAYDVLAKPFAAAEVARCAAMACLRWRQLQAPPPQYVKVFA